MKEYIESLFDFRKKTSSRIGTILFFVFFAKVVHENYNAGNSVNLFSSGLYISSSSLKVMFWMLVFVIALNSLSLVFSMIRQNILNELEDLYVGNLEESSEEEKRTFFIKRKRFGFIYINAFLPTDNYDIIKEYKKIYPVRIACKKEECLFKSPSDNPLLVTKRVFGYYRYTCSKCEETFRSFSPPKIIAEIEAKKVEKKVISKKLNEKKVVSLEERFESNSE